MTTKVIPESPLKVPMKKRTGPTKYIVVHCSASGPTSTWGWKELNQLHVKTNGWAAIGYHVVIKRDGTIEAGRPLDTVGAHAEGINSASVGVCLIGGLNGKRTDPFLKNFTKEQEKSLIAVLCELGAAYPEATTIPHNKVANKECPAFDFNQWVNTLPD